MAAVMDFDKIKFKDFDYWIVHNPFDKLTFKDFDKDAIEYYLPMEISKKKKKKRIQLAQQIYEVVVVWFYYIKESRERDMFDEDYALEFFRKQITPIVKEETKVVEEIPKKQEHKEYIQKYIHDMTDDILYATLINTGMYLLSTKTSNSLTTTNSYWLSKKRATVIALNESNTICNYGELLEAINAGFTKKKWLTMKDDKVRITHDMVDDVVKPINGYFEVGNDLMLYPHDYVNCNNPEEIVNCRCSLEYLR